MSVEAHFKAAAAELRKAALEKRHDIDELKKQITQKEQMVRQYVDQMRKDQRQKERLSGNSEIDDKQRADLQRAAKQNLGQITDAEKGLTKDKDILRQSIAAIERDIMDLEQRATALESRS